jgi:Zn-dependent peptidase ImmA (M78 family)/O-acetyl-ADP-ribose deacetylase (regulator of RNase III)
MGTTAERWTNPSVLALGGTADPVSAIAQKTRALVLKAIDLGWSGPPFDPLRLAELLGYQVLPDASVREARLVATQEGKPRIEYNPTRPRGRVRYSIAHEIVHTFFEDWADQVRHRGVPNEEREDDWQLEALCNIGAAEILMPTGDCGSLGHPDADIHQLLDEQKRFDVSTEALLIRAVRIREDSCAVFCASRKPEGGGHGYSLDYVITSRTWNGQLRRGHKLPPTSIVTECTAVGFTAKGEETWSSDLGRLKVQCVGIPPYPGSTSPRVVGLLQPANGRDNEMRGIEVLRGDATTPRGEGTRIIAHIVTDSAQVWGGGGFAAALRRAYPALAEDFRKWVISSKDNLALGRTHYAEPTEGLTVASMVAQHGYNKDVKVKLRYEALSKCLSDVASHAKLVTASVHMPRIGTGLAGGNWDLIKEIIEDTLVAKGVPVTVYDLPPK